MFCTVVAEVRCFMASEVNVADEADLS